MNCSRCSVALEHPDNHDGESERCRDCNDEIFAEDEAEERRERAYWRHIDQQIEEAKDRRRGIW